jgi:ubiquitin carboxyl-terminal hydrolase 36/42
MSWAEELAWPPETKPIGCALLNLGNTCFVNSVLQCLAHTPPLALGCVQASDAASILPGGLGSARAMHLLAEDVRDSLLSDARPFTPSLASHMHEVSDCLTHGQQEDAHEFIRLLIDAASRQTKDERAEAVAAHAAASKLGGAQAGSARPLRPFVEEIFLGQLQSSVSCSACGSVSRSAEDFLDLSLEIGADGADDGASSCDSLHSALATFLGPEELGETDQYYCEKCAARVPATKQFRLAQLPPVLLLHLKRFRQQRWGRAKIGAHIPFPLVLDVAEFVASAPEGDEPGDAADGPAADECHHGGADGADGLAPPLQRPHSPPHPVVGGEPFIASAGEGEGSAPAASAPPEMGKRQSGGGADASRRDGSPAPSSRARANGGCEREPRASRERYALYAVIVHRGRAVQSGHYLAYVRALASPSAAAPSGVGSECAQGGGRWWCFDDSHAYEVDEDCVLGQPAYMTFYLRDDYWQGAPRLPDLLPRALTSVGDGREADAQELSSRASSAPRRTWLLVGALLLASCAWLARSQLELASADASSSVEWLSDSVAVLRGALGGWLAWFASLGQTAARTSGQHAAGGRLTPHGSEPRQLVDPLPQLEAFAERLGPALRQLSAKHVYSSFFAEDGGSAFFDDEQEPSAYWSSELLSSAEDDRDESAAQPYKESED